MGIQRELTVQDVPLNMEKNAIGIQRELTVSTLK